MEQLNTYTAEFGIYINCHISSVEERTIEAATIEEAEAKAKTLGEEIEADMAATAPEGYKDADFWANLEDLYEE